MSSPLRTIRAFSVELMKIAAEVQDADIRKLLSERKGKEYLDGGRLLSNSAAEAEYAIKMATSGGYSAPVGLAVGSGSLDVLKSHKKKKNSYQTARDYAGTAMKGGLTGLGVLGAANAMRGRFGSPTGNMAIRHAARRAATVGAGIAVVDRAYRYDDLPTSEKKAFAVSANPTSSFQSPARSLMQSSQTGGFRSGIIHDTGTAPKSLTMGKNFRLP
jgi:hypothetical protein